jgi:hypothetical protein
MNPVKLLASRNIIIGVAVVATLFVAFVLLHTRTGSSETMPSAARIGLPPAPDGDVVPIDTILSAYQRSRTNALRHYRTSPFTAAVDAVTPMRRNGWVAAVVVNGGRTTMHFAEQPWRAIEQPLAAGQTRTFTCADWQSGPSGTLLMYGCGVVN